VTTSTPQTPTEGFEWLDEPVTIHFKEDGIPGLRRGELDDESKASLQARFTAQEKKLWAEGYHTGTESQAKQHQVEVLKARIDELGRTPFVRIGKDSFFGPGWASNRYDRLEAQLIQLTGENSNE
jgi:hypothetical protein